MEFVCKPAAFDDRKLFHKKNKTNKQGKQKTMSICVRKKNNSKALLIP